MSAGQLLKDGAGLRHVSKFLMRPLGAEPARSASNNCCCCCCSSTSRSINISSCIGNRGSSSCSPSHSTRCGRGSCSLTRPHLQSQFHSANLFRFREFSIFFIGCVIYRSVEFLGYCFLRSRISGRDNVRCVPDSGHLGSDKKFWHHILLQNPCTTPESVRNAQRSRFETFIFGCWIEYSLLLRVWKSFKCPMTYK